MSREKCRDFTHFTESPTWSAICLDDVSPTRGRAAARLSEEVAMDRKAQGKAKTRKRSVARDLTVRNNVGLTGGILYNGHAGLGADTANAAAFAVGRIVTDNKDADGKY
jgi:hypothetical protein